MASLAAVGGVLAQRNERICYGGSVACRTGSWMQRVATDWLARGLTHSAFWVSVLAFCNPALAVMLARARLARMAPALEASETLA